MRHYAWPTAGCDWMVSDKACDLPKTRPKPLNTGRAGAARGMLTIWVPLSADGRLKRWYAMARRSAQMRSLCHFGVGRAKWRFEARCSRHCEMRGERFS